MLRQRSKYDLLFGLTFLLAGFTACRDKGDANASVNGEILFERMDQEVTGIRFNNQLKPTPELNLFNYIYFYNGGGIAAGDFNNDGLIDLFFAANQGRNTLYLNKGGMKFEDITERAGILADSAWSTGLSVVDINNDGMLDIYVCRVGKYLGLNSHNQLLVCKGVDKEGVPRYEDQSQAYGLDFSGFSTQAVFFDYDGDGDLDMYLLNHSVHSTGAFAPRATYMGTFHPLAGDRLFRNDQGKFTDVTHEVGINSTAIGYGLGIGVSDLDLDGYPDVYVGNDFPENDYLYINQHNGKFRDEINEHIMHTSQFSMGVDIADLNNDGFPEIFSLDMMPHDPEILKRSQLEEGYDAFQLKRNYGFNYQYTRNNLQYNRKNGMFSEIGQYAGVFDTDWSWAPLWCDFDNDGKKDLFVSNGIPKRMNDIDFIKFISDGGFRQQLQEGKISELEANLLNKFPENKLRNKFFLNKGSIRFEDETGAVKDNQPTFSNGAIYADLDNDGDLDIVVNNIDDPATIYRNRSNDQKGKHHLDLKLKGPAQNVNALGSKILLYSGKDIQFAEKWPVRGYLSSMEIPVHFGLGDAGIDSLIVVWPDNSFQKIDTRSKDTTLNISYNAGLPKFDYARLRTMQNTDCNSMEDISSATKLRYLHTEDQFVDFNWEPLVPHMLSTEGPALAVGDLNHDGLDDVFIGGAKNHRGAIFFQNHQGQFSQAPNSVFQPDSSYEDVDACIVDVNNDGWNDLIVASGGNEYVTLKKYLQPQLYLNNGKRLVLQEQAFQNISTNASCITAADFNGDGFADLFVGGRSVPWEYGQTPVSFLLVNDGKGGFKNVTESVSKGLGKIGMVTQALWTDIDKDGDPDLVLCLEWGGICVYINDHGTFTRKMITTRKGWWNFILPLDVDNDGDMDFVAGNLGENTMLDASVREPVKLFYTDFDGSGKKEQLMTYYLDGKDIPFASIDELEKKIPSLKKKFLYARDFAKASLGEIFPAEKLKSADSLSADLFSSMLFINNGNMNFEARPLPWEAQLSTFRSAIVVNANGDSLPDVLMMGNFYDNTVQMGRSDADFGTILINKGKGEFSCTGIPGLVIKGQVRQSRRIKLGGREAFVLARNNDSTMVIRFKK